MNHSADPNEALAPDHFHATADVGAQRVARVYAESLLNAAAKRNEVDDTLEELRALIADVFTKQPQIEDFICGGGVGRERKAAVLRETFGGRASELFLNFLLVLNDHDRLELLRPILAASEELNNERKDRIPVQVRSAVPLADDQRERLTTELRATFHGEPVLHLEVDPDLLGGLVVRVGDWVYDASVRTQLATVRNQLIERSSHEIQSRRDSFCNL